MKHVYVNRQEGAVMIYDEAGRALTVHPLSKQAGCTDDDAVFEVEGEHFAQFASAKGPLYPKFPAEKKRPVVSAPPAPVAPPAAPERSESEPVVPDAVDDAPDATEPDPESADGDSSDGDAKPVTETKKPVKKPVKKAAKKKKAKKKGS